MAKKTIGVFVGSARRDSYNKKIALEVCKYLPADFEVKMMDMANLPLYNQDYDDDGNTPKAWDEFRKQVAELDAFFFVTPEYNRSMPPLLKNALDIASRPYGQNRWNAKPGAIMSVSTGAIGGFGSNNQLRQTMAFLNVFVMQQPEGYIGNIPNLIDENGNVVEKTRDFLRIYAEAYANWVKRF